MSSNRRCFISTLQRYGVFVCPANFLTLFQKKVLCFYFPFVNKGANFRSFANFTFVHRSETLFYNSTAKQPRAYLFMHEKIGLVLPDLSDPTEHHTEHHTEHTHRTPHRTPTEHTHRTHTPNTTPTKAYLQPLKRQRTHRRPPQRGAGSFLRKEKKSKKNWGLDEQIIYRQTIKNKVGFPMWKPYPIQTKGLCLMSANGPFPLTRAYLILFVLATTGIASKSVLVGHHLYALQHAGHGQHLGIDGHHVGL